MRKAVVIFLLLTSLLNGWGQSIEISIGLKYQTIEGFGASDCWTVQYVGKYWPLPEKEKAAQWLFSTENDSKGNPLGIGLSIWRFNVGGGTIEQGDSSDMNADITRRAECFVGPDGKYDWDKQIGQQWFLQKAKKYGCPTFVAFSNTPPVYYTRNGKGYAPKDGNSNLRTDHYDDFARFLVKVVKHFKKKGIHFEYISPVNEPQWDWSGTYQEGCPWQNEEIKLLLTLLDQEIRDKNLDTKMLITEAGSWDNIYKMNKRASNQIYAFFDKSSPLYAGNLSTLSAQIGAHSYWTDQTHARLKEERTQAKREADKYGLKLHQTEWSLLSNPPLEGLEDYGKATYMDIALYMTKVIHSDLVYADVSSWSFWTSMDIELWGFKDRFNLIRLETSKGDVESIVEGGKVSPVKTLWALGQYSRFIRPGYVRVEMKGADDLSSVFGSAYLSPDAKELVTVYSNMTDKRVSLPVIIKNEHTLVPSKPKGIYVTNDTLDMALQMDCLAGDEIEIPSRSVVSVLYILN